MWEPTPPTPDADLRQGDLLGPLHAPRLEIPFRVTKYPNASDDGADAVFGMNQSRHHLVVSHCCTMEQGKYIAVAPVVSTPSVGEDERPAYFGEPTEGGKYVIKVHALEELEDVITYSDHRLRAADLERIMSVRLEVSEAKSLRVAAMTPEGRRLLRIRLGLFWARPEESDVVELASRGLPPGVHADA